MSIATTALLLLAACATSQAPPGEQEMPPDPSDPTRIEARAGVGYKYTDYTRDASMNEVRAKLALMVGTEGTFVADVGVGRVIDHPVDDDETGLTDGRFRYFHLWDIDRTVTGYQGWGTSAEIQTQGNVPGTDSSNLLALGALWAFQLGEHVSIFPNLIASGIWSRNLDDYLGTAVRGDLIVTWKPPGAWNGAYVKMRPSYSYGLGNDVGGEGNGEIEVAVGGAFDREKRWWWDLQGRWFFEEDLDEVPDGIASQWSLFASFTYFF